MPPFLKSWLLPFLWMVAIFFVSTDLGSPAHTSLVLEPLLHWLKPDISQGTVDQIHFLVRKTAHLCVYAVLAILCWRALRRGRAGSSSLANAGIALLIAAAFAASDEFHQSFYSSRHASAWDVLIDCCGGLAGLGVALGWDAMRIRLARRV